MILTCPECATSYFVADGRIPPEGRRVKCTSCGARWKADADGDPLQELLAEPAAAAPAPDLDIEPEIASTAADDDLIIETREREPESEAPPEMEETGLRQRPASAPPLRRPSPVQVKDSRSGPMLWGGMAALVAALVAGAVVFRGDLVRLWPQSSAAFAGVGLDVPGGGLVIEEVRAEPTFVSGRPALEVTGAIRNVRGVSASPPPLRVSLVNRAGKPVAAKTARTADESIPAHARRYFAVAIVDPPADSHDLEVTFLAEKAKAPRASHESEAAVTPQHGPEEAKPLAPGTADALPEHG